MTTQEGNQLLFNERAEGMKLFHKWNLANEAFNRMEIRKRIFIDDVTLRKPTVQVKEKINKQGFVTVVQNTYTYKVCKEGEYLGNVRISVRENGEIYVESNDNQLKPYIDTIEKFFSYQISA